jgi:FK506-binding protein 6
MNFSLFLDGDVNPFDCTYARGRPERFNLSACSLLPGLQSAVMTMKKTEISEFIINYSLAYGIMGCAPRFNNIILEKPLKATI